MILEVLPDPDVCSVVVDEDGTCSVVVDGYLRFACQMTEENAEVLIEVFRVLPGLLHDRQLWNDRLEVALQHLSAEDAATLLARAAKPGRPPPPVSPATRSAGRQDPLADVAGLLPWLPWRNGVQTTPSDDGRCDVWVGGLDPTHFASSMEDETVSRLSVALFFLRGRVERMSTLRIRLDAAWQLLDEDGRQAVLACRPQQ